MTKWLELWLLVGCVMALVLNGRGRLNVRNLSIIIIFGPIWVGQFIVREIMGKSGGNQK